MRANHANYASEGTGWSPWRTVWSEISQGSGSGLIADKVTAYAAVDVPSAVDRGEGALIFITGAGGGLAVSDGAVWTSLS
ncbi:hypothetical protein GCM10009069_05020 [Algimonas arctica]|uniref:Uncharacterized protein n=1 Tax=Algimonas arctica TaxID=1479486 RepID=A0A8J3CPZ9_9PROT|nr:hypothetical protein GCM10009069_05020 [Algimonas arctica]